jgi:predicted phage terminase large subunit-like protein
MDDNNSPANWRPAISSEYIADKGPADMAQRLTSQHQYHKRHAYQIPKHIDLLQKLVLQAIEPDNISDDEYNEPDRDDTQRNYRNKKHLIVSMPPRHGKSEFISFYLPIWFAARFPGARIIIVGYSMAFAQSFGRKIIDFFVDFADMLRGLEIKKEGRSRSNIVLNNGSSIICVGIGGSLTGRGADLLIIDDPIKSNAQSSSSTIRDSIDDWFKSTAFSRLEPGGSCIIVMTRWNEDDLVGRILTDPDRVAHFAELCLPAIAENRDPLGRKEGEPLWPERYDLEALQKIELASGRSWFQALYQQQPLPESGRIFDISDFGRYALSGELISPSKNNINRNALPVTLSECTIYTSCDLAIAGGQQNDKTVFLTAAFDRIGNIFVLDADIFPGNTISNKKRLLQLYKRYGPSQIGVEQVAYQLTFLDQMRMEGLPITAIKPRNSKQDRAKAMQPYVEGGMVYLPKNAHWLTEFEKQIATFPDSKHDDIVDAFVYLKTFISSRGFKPISIPRQNSTNYP